MMDHRHRLDTCWIMDSDKRRLENSTLPCSLHNVLKKVIEHDDDIVSVIMGRSKIAIGVEDACLGTATAGREGAIP
jgi:sulfopyruvate decarboxylase TPP-binding subunit